MSLQIEAQHSIFLHTLKNANFIFYNLKDIILLNHNYKLKSITGLHFFCFLKCPFHAHCIQLSFCTELVVILGHTTNCVFKQFPKALIAPNGILTWVHRRLGCMLTSWLMICRAGLGFVWISVGNPSRHLLLIICLWTWSYYLMGMWDKMALCTTSETCTTSTMCTTGDLLFENLFIVQSFLIIL